jgi:hypothetical protein
MKLRDNMIAPEERCLLIALCAAWLLKEYPSFQLKKHALVMDDTWKKRALDFYILVGATYDPDKTVNVHRFVLNKKAYASAKRGLEEAPRYANWLTTPSSEWD